MCETLGALCSQFYHERFDLSAPRPTNQMDIDEPSTPNAFQQLLPRLLEKVESIVDNNEIDKQVQLVEILSAVCLQSMLGYFMPKHVLDIFENVLNATNHWTQYRIARSASRYGQHFLAAKIYDRLASIVSLEKLHFFLSGLSQISKAECILNHGCEFTEVEAGYVLGKHQILYQTPLGISERLEKAVSLYLKALATLKVIENKHIFCELYRPLNVILFRRAHVHHIHSHFKRNSFGCVANSWKHYLTLSSLKIHKRLHRPQQLHQHWHRTLEIICKSMAMSLIN